MSEPAAAVLAQAARPRFRGVSHLIAFGVSAVAGIFLVADATGVAARLAAAVFGVTVAAMFGASALYHRVDWSLAARRWMRRVDHAGIYLLIGGSYTPFALFGLDGAWRVGVLAAAWTGVALGTALRFAWPEAPGWLSATVALSLGWVSVVALPEAFGALGLGAFGLLLAGGILYSLGGLVYALRRPNPFPSTFGFHEVFHVLVVGAVACHYSSVAFFLLSGS